MSSVVVCDYAAESPHAFLVGMVVVFLVYLGIDTSVAVIAISNEMTAHLAKKQTSAVASRQ